MTKKTFLIYNKLLILIVLQLILVLCTRTKIDNLTGNIEFKNELDKYLYYLDSIGYNREKEIVLLICKEKNDSLFIEIKKNCGFNDIIKWNEKFIDEIIYTGHHLVLLNDYPNEIINLKRNNKLTIETILTTFFPKEYLQFKLDSLIGPPWIYDGNITALIFKEKVLVARYFDVNCPFNLNPKINSRLLEINKWLLADTQEIARNQYTVLIDTSFSEEENNFPIYNGDEIDKLPTFQGGEKDLFKFIEDHIVYPKVDINNKTNGIVIVSFLITEKGTIDQISVLKSIGEKYDREAVNVVKKMPRWNPG